MVCSTDGYLSTVSFQQGELGTQYHPPPVATPEVEVARVLVPPEPTLPACEPGPVVMVAPPAKKQRVTPTLVAAKRAAEEVGEAVQNLTLEAVPKKKKRIQPMLISN